MVLVVCTGDDAITRVRIIVPRWQEPEAGWDGPHKMEIAVPLADSYAEAYGYHAVAIDIESSQIWQPEWATW